MKAFWKRALQILERGGIFVLILVPSYLWIGAIWFRFALVPLQPYMHDNVNALIAASPPLLVGCILSCYFSRAKHPSAWIATSWILGIAGFAYTETLISRMTHESAEARRQQNEMAAVIAKVPLAVYSQAQAKFFEKHKRYDPTLRVIFDGASKQNFHGGLSKEDKVIRYHCPDCTLNARQFKVAAYYRDGIDFYFFTIDSHTRWTEETFTDPAF